jgi:glycosyltransferase involved in cell wall biosynthesis
MPIFIDHSLAKVSIIISTYNGAKYIGETIESIRSQTYSNWELIIIDDGSDDDTMEVVKGVKDERIQLHKAGRIGINGRIKNIGLSKASGDLVAFLDHDDLWAPSKLEKQVAALQKYPEAGFCLSGGYNFKKPGEPLEYFYKKTGGVRFDNVFISFFKSELPGYTQALMLRRECIAVSGTFREDKSFSDVDFILNLAWHFKAIVLYEPLLFRRLHDSNSNRLSWEKGFYEGIEIIQSYKKELPPEIVKDALFGVYLNFGEACLSNKKERKAAQQFLKAWTYKPFRIVTLKKMVKTIWQALKK